MELTKIHPDDDMFQGSIEHYLSCGEEFAEIIVHAAAMSSAREPQILELPCGYGRVTRHLVRYFASSEITAADVMAPAVDYCSATFGVTGVVVQEPVNEFPNIPDGAFDVIAMGSLVTHLSESNARLALTHFLRKLAPGGIAVISTHGARVFELLSTGAVWFELAPTDREQLLTSYQRDAYGFAYYAAGHAFERKTVDYVGDHYGVSLIPHSWMIRALAVLGYTVVRYQVGGWDNHQDVYIISA